MKIPLSSMNTPLSPGKKVPEFECFDNPLSQKVSLEILKGHTYKRARHIDDIGVVLDIGANIGASALFFAKICPQAKIFAFEPAEEPYRLLQKNAKLCGRIATYNFGMFSSDKKVSLYKGVHDCVTGSVGESVESRTDSETVILRSIQGWLTENAITQIDLLKIDTEGCELPILRSVSDLIPSIKIIYLEYHSESDRKEIDCMLGETHILAAGNVLHMHRGEFTYVAKSTFSDPRDLSRHEIKVNL